METLHTKDILEPNEGITGKAACPAGKSILGGGGFATIEAQSGDSAGQDVPASMPVERSAPIGGAWHLTVRNTMPTAQYNVTLSVIAICADLSP